MDTIKASLNTGGILLKKHITLNRLTALLWSFVRAVLIIGISFYILYPLLIKVSLAFMDKQDIYDVTVSFIPKNFTLENIKAVFENMNYPTAFFNSLVLTHAYNGIAACFMYVGRIWLCQV